MNYAALYVAVIIGGAIGTFLGNALYQYWSVQQLVKNSEEMEDAIKQFKADMGDCDDPECGCKQ